MYNTEFCSSRIIDQALIMSKIAEQFEFTSIELMPVPYRNFTSTGERSRMLRLRKANSAFHLPKELTEHEACSEGLSTFKIVSTKADIHLIAFGDYWRIFYDSYSQVYGGFPYSFAYKVLLPHYLEGKNSVQLQSEIKSCPILRINSLISVDFYMILDQLQFMIDAKLIK
jgi:hypothetical protein